MIEEGSEPDDFWSALGGQDDYCTEIDLDKPILEPRLFHCRKVADSFRAVEINNFEQEVRQLGSCTI